MIAAFTNNLTVEYVGYNLFQSYAVKLEYTANGNILYSDSCIEQTLLEQSKTVFKASFVRR